MIYFFGPIAFAQTPSHLEPQILNDKILNQKLGNEWRGIVFICDPYCEFISLRESQQWNPAIGERQIRLEKLYLVSQVDPLYPLLISHVPVLPFVEGKLKAQKGKDQEADGRMRRAPSYAVTSYGLGWSLQLGGILNLMQLASNTEIQTGLAPEKYYFLPSLSGMLALRPHRLFGLWIQHSLEGTFSTGSYRTKDNFEVNTSARSFTYRTLNFGRRFRIGPHVTWKTDEVKLASDSLTHFSYSWNAYLLGIEAIWKRWSLYGDTSILSTMNERQSFRQSPLRQSWYRLGTRYCSRDFSIFDINFGFCSNLDYVFDRQKAALSNNLISSNSQIDIQKWEFGLSLRVGEDFFK